MFTDQQRLAICAAHLANVNVADDFDGFIAWAKQQGLGTDLKRLLTSLDALPLVRRFHRENFEVPVPPSLALEGDAVVLAGTPIGGLQTWYRTALPQETQARIAYDSLIDRFLANIQYKHKVVVFEENDMSLRVFVPAGKIFQLGDEWKSFVQNAFSGNELRRTFVLVLNSVPMGKQFHDLELPIVTPDQAEVLAAYFYTYGDYLKDVVIGNREREVAKLVTRKAELEGLMASESLDGKKRAKAGKELADLPEKISKARADLEDKHKTHDGAITVFESLPLSMERRKQIAQKARNWFLRGATEKMTGRPDSEAKRFRRIVELASTTQKQLDPIPQLFADNFPEWAIRPPGDFVDGTCFTCGRQAADMRERWFQANKFIIASPRQTLQSKPQTNTGQSVPKICSHCAAIAMVSPIKLSGDSLVIRLRQRGEFMHYATEDALRAYTVGELNITAGKYLLLLCLEPIRGQSMMKRLGGREYALYKLSALFAGEVFETYQVECLFGGEPIRLPSRHLIALRTLIEVFDAEPSLVKGNRAKFDTVSEAIRYLEADALNAAVYVIAKTFMGGRFFGFGEERKSYIFPFRIFHGLRRNLFVFDEVHAYEDTAFTNFVNLIKALYTANLDLVVMTATMPDNYARELGFLRTIDYLSSNQPHPKILRYVPLNDKTPQVEAILKQVNLLQAPDRRLIVTVEFVKTAVEVWEGLGKPLLYHGRLDNRQRRKVYAELKRKECNGEGYLLVTTSAIEVGCDLNADHLITEICNPASLIQRAGRCNRRGDLPNAEVVVVGNAISRHIREISEEQESEFIAALRRKTGELFQPADFFRFMERSVTFDYRVEILFDMLFEYVYEGKLENKPLHDKGLVVTRSWEPSVTLTENKETMAHAISVPLSRCLTAADKVDNQCKVYVRYFNRKFHSQNEYEIVFKELQWGGCAYFQDLVIEAPPIDPVRGWVEIPRPFIRGRQEGYRVTVRYPRKEDDRDVYLFFIRWRPETEEPTQPLETTTEENTLEETVDNSSDNEP